MSEPTDGAFRKIIDEEVGDFIQASKAFGSKYMDSLASKVKQAFEAQYVFIRDSGRRGAPTNDEELASLTEPTFGILRNIQEFRESNRQVVEYSNHMATVAESVMALSWVSVPKTPVQFIRDMKEAGDYFGNRVLTSNKGNESHNLWINKWNSVLIALEGYVRHYYRTGFVWSASGNISAPSSHPVPPPPPPPEFDADNAPAVPAVAADRQALLQDLNQGLEIVNKLKKVNRNVPRPASAPAGGRTGRSTTRRPRSIMTIRPDDSPAPPPVFMFDGKKWLVEYQEDEHNLVVIPTDKSDTLVMYMCDNCTLEIRDKLKSVTIDKCHRCVIILQDVICNVELIRCQYVEIRCKGSCPNITVDNCASVQIFLYDASANCQVISSKSASTNICRVNADGDYTEFAVPEQFRSRFVENRLVTSVVQHM